MGVSPVPFMLLLHPSAAGFCNFATNHILRLVILDRGRCQSFQICTITIGRLISASQAEGERGHRLSMTPP